MERSPLHDTFASHGARFHARGDRLVPDSVLGFEMEYRAAADSLAIGDGQARCRLRVTGQDHLTFLQNMVSNDVKALEPGSGAPATLLNRKGKLLADLIMYRQEDGILLDLEHDRIETVAHELSRYIISEDVHLENLSTLEATIVLQGPLSLDLLSEMADSSISLAEPYRFSETTVGTSAVRASNVRHGPAMGVDLSVNPREAASIVERLLERGQSRGAMLAGEQALEARRIEAGIPRFGVDMDESHFPLEAGLEAALSFTKGCYIGQEYVARMAHRGHVNKKLRGLRILGERVPPSGEEIKAGERSIGHVTSAALSPDVGGSIALGYVHRDFMEPETEVLLATTGERAKVTPLPFIEKC